MGTITENWTEAPSKKRHLVEMSWDPITRIVGSLGIFTKIDFENKQVVECYSTSSIFRGYSIFMQGKDPRDAHFITSRICGICGDNHATCACYAQNMAFGVKPPALAEWIINLGEAAEYMFDHNIFQDNLVGVDFCEQMVKETNPGLWEKAQQKSAPHAAIHGYRTIADIMKALNPFTGEFYRETLHEPADARDVLPDGRPPRASFHLVSRRRGYGGDRAAVHRLSRAADEVCGVHEESACRCTTTFSILVRALPGYEKVGERRVLLGCWGAFNNPEVCDYRYENMSDWGRHMFVTPGVIVDGKLVTNDLVDINLGIRILLGSSYYDDWQDGRRSSRPIRWAIRSTSATHGTRPPSRGRRSATSRATTRGSCRRVGTTNAGDYLRAGYRRRAARTVLVHGALRTGRHRLHQSHRP